MQGYSELASSNTQRRESLAEVSAVRQATALRVPPMVCLSPLPVLRVVRTAGVSGRRSLSVVTPCKGCALLLLGCSHPGGIALLMVSPWPWCGTCSCVFFPFPTPPFFFGLKRTPPMKPSHRGACRAVFLIAHPGVQGLGSPSRQLQPVTAGRREDNQPKGVLEETIGDRLVDSFTAQSLDLPPQAAKVLPSCQFLLIITLFDHLCVQTGTPPHRALCAAATLHVVVQTCL